MISFMEILVVIYFSIALGLFIIWFVTGEGSPFDLKFIIVHTLESILMAIFWLPTLILYKIWTR